MKLKRMRKARERKAGKGRRNKGKGGMSGRDGGRGWQKGRGWSIKERRREYGERNDGCWENEKDRKGWIDMKTKRKEEEKGKGSGGKIKEG
jgi:hypothetical protein